MIPFLVFVLVIYIGKLLLAPPKQGYLPEQRDGLKLLLAAFVVLCLQEPLRTLVGIHFDGETRATAILLWSGGGASVWLFFKIWGGLRSDESDSKEGDGS